MAAYLSVARFKLLSTIPTGFVDEVEALQPGFVDAQLEFWSAWIDSQLTKRYAVPFVSPYPLVVEGWLTRIVTVRVWSKRGVNPTDEQWAETKEDDKAARAEIDRAANSDTGLFELPLRQNTVDSGVARGFPRGYSEASPYVWTDVQAQCGRDEDDAGSGTYT
jgi:hypothetical protein